MLAGLRLPNEVNPPLLPDDPWPFRIEEVGGLCFARRVCRPVTRLFCPTPLASSPHTWPANSISNVSGLAPPVIPGQRRHPLIWQSVHRLPSLEIRLENRRHPSPSVSHFPAQYRCPTPHMPSISYFLQAANLCGGTGSSRGPPVSHFPAQYCCSTPHMAQYFLTPYKQPTYAVDYFAPGLTRIKARNDNDVVRCPTTCGSVAARKRLFGGLQIARVRSQAGQIDEANPTAVRLE
jgi:hypothetical protein